MGPPVIIQVLNDHNLSIETNMVTTGVPPFVETSK